MAAPRPYEMRMNVMFLASGRLRKIRSGEAENGAFYCAAQTAA
jgi:hypothetical protein